jgi:hypothetical protein
VRWQLPGPSSVCSHSSQQRGETHAGSCAKPEEFHMQNEFFIENQIREDGLWSEKNVRASELLCKVAPRFVQGGPGRPSGEHFAFFPRHRVRNRILSHLNGPQRSTLSSTQMLPDSSAMVITSLSWVSESPTGGMNRGIISLGLSKFET